MVLPRFFSFKVFHCLSDLIFMVLGIEFRDSYMLNNYFATESFPQLQIQNNSKGLG